jgi:ATP-binding cassette, subfamily B, multidrug efflux pump
MRLFSRFEGLVSPFPLEIIQKLPTKFWPFMWACSYGMRKYILLMTLLTACIGAFEALLFALMGKVVDKLTAIAP